MVEMASTPVVPTETNPDDYTTATTYRDTKDGRRLHYELTCLQQPERARACGSGQKSAADRRPVDPPPVVQLRVFEGPTRDEAKDVTPTYLSSFFVYADLQHARPMATGRVQTPAATSHPVLTGSPVSGMCLLDRPVEAGYFLFPDLSVRHEGRYVLGFTLYEEIKNEGDEDAEPMEDDPTPGFYLRMRVVSSPFHVYSAKKFPGLKCSTDLSRTISEQGCRVRIRRDVRMRRRSDKPGAGGEFKDEEASRSRRTPTPVDSGKAQQYRGRSASNSSQHREPYSAKSERRPSDVDLGYAPPPPPGSSHVRYGSDTSNAPHSSQFIQPAPQVPPISPTAASYSGQPSPYAAVPPSQPHYPYSNRPTPYPPTTPSDTYDRRSSAATAIPPSPSHSHLASIKDEYRRESAFKQEPDYTRTLEPLRRDSLPLSAGSAPLSATSLKLPPLTDLARNVMPGPSFSGLAPYHPRPVVGNDYIEPAPPSKPRIEELVRAGSKRAFNDTFGENTKALYNGERPVDHHHKLAGRAGLIDFHEEDVLVYPRADGNLSYKQPNRFYPA